MNVFLVGMPGSGKSTAGKKLAARLGLQFIDLDKYIENKTGQKISVIFQEKGEAAFRQIEHECLKEIVTEKTNILVATGGGAPCFHNNMELINSAGISIYVEMPAAVLRSRLMQGNNERPLFSGLSSAQILEKLNSLINERDRYYSSAHITVHGTNLDVDSLAELIRIQKRV